MTIELPKKLIFYHGNSKIKIKGGILFISNLANWRELMTHITVAKKGKKCWYCGKRLKNNQITMDHLFPQDVGGPTISNNLAPACSRCNSKKGNLTEFQYRHCLSAPQKKKNILREKFLKENESRKYKTGYFLPKKWITSRRIDNVLVNINIHEQYKGKKYNKIEEFYKKYGNLPYPIIIDKNNYLLDGFLLLMFAKNNEIERVPTIVLKNVEVIFNK